VLDGGRRAAAAQLCRRLDGIPLAVELAAVRLRVLTLEEIIQRLNSRFDLLVAGNRGAQPRQQTLRATFDWSWGLLSEEEQTLWQRLSVFVGGFDLGAAEAVCGGNGLPPEHVLPVLAGLVEKSVVQHDASSAAGRYQMLETIREYGRERLEASGDLRLLRRLHEKWVARLAYSVQAHSVGPDAVEWFDRMNMEHGNLRSALQFCLDEPEEGQAGLTIAADLWLYWQARGHMSEGRRWISSFLSVTPATEPARARALWVAGYLAVSQGDVAVALRLLDEALSLARRLRVRSDEAFALHYLGLAAIFQQRADLAVPLLTQAIAAHEEVGEPGPAFAQADLGVFEALVGRVDAATPLLERSLRLSRERGDRWTQAHALWGLGLVAWRLAAHERAAALVRESLVLFRSVDERAGIARAVLVLAWITLAEGKPADAAVLLGSAAGLYRSIPAAVPGILDERHQSCLRSVRDRLTVRAFQSAYQRGERMTPAEAVAHALGEPASPEFGRAALSGTGLSKRELEVATAVAAGLTNRQIADRLVIAERTVETHVAHIMDKLGCENRSQVGHWFHMTKLHGAD
jgi:non-specific serine/threonine protein kinase